MSNSINSLQCLEDQWSILCKVFLPIEGEAHSIWRQSRTLTIDDPTQGWKLHISATILSAVNLLQEVAPYLYERDVLFKAPRTLVELKRLNCGLFYGFSQVGKCITVYPRSEAEAVLIANELHKLTCSIPGPVVPYDRLLKQNSRIHYRYGSFHSLETQDIKGEKVAAIQKPTGELIPDSREPNSAVPPWVKDPFFEPNQSTNSPPLTPLITTFRVYQALSQRGKGGVYRALDVSTSPARLSILKEGRTNGETDVDGRDGYWRVRHEASILQALHEAGINVPRVYASFKIDDNFYLAMENIEGRNLQELLGRKKLSIMDALDYGQQIATTVDDIHSAGWVWRDCKPLNWIVTDENILRPLDFEGASPIDCPDPMPWGTIGYVPPQWLDISPTRCRLPDDLYALGATLYHLFTSKIPSETSPIPIGKLRRKIPLSVRKIITDLLSDSSVTRPSARIVAETLSRALDNCRSSMNNN